MIEVIQSMKRSVLIAVLVVKISTVEFYCLKAIQNCRVQDPQSIIIITSVFNQGIQYKHYSCVSVNLLTALVL